MKKIIILAGNRGQFENYLDDNGLTDSEAVHGWSPEVLIGIEASKVEVVGTFWRDKKDAGKIYDFALARVSPSQEGR